MKLLRHTYVIEHIVEQLGNVLELIVCLYIKTLVTVGKSGEHYVFMLPACDELDLKKAAKAAHDKKVELIHVKELLPLTGYVRGGCSPIGMKKAFPTFLDETAQLYDEIGISAGCRGCQILLAPDALINYVNSSLCDLTE